MYHSTNYAGWIRLKIQSYALLKSPNGSLRSARCFRSICVSLNWFYLVSWLFLRLCSLFVASSHATSHGVILVVPRTCFSPFQIFPLFSQANRPSTFMQSKKPLNPVLGEVSVCKFYSKQPRENSKNNKGNYERDDEKDVFYGLSEQISHHPPISAYLYQTLLLFSTWLRLFPAHPSSLLNHIIASLTLASATLRKQTTGN